MNYRRVFKLQTLVHSHGNGNNLDVHTVPAQPEKSSEAWGDAAGRHLFRWAKKTKSRSPYLTDIVVKPVSCDYNADYIKANITTMNEYSCYSKSNRE